MSNERLKETIEDGSYYKEARRWYNDVFLCPIRSNSFMLGASFSIVVVLIGVLYSIYNVFPLSEEVRVVVHMSNTMDFKAKLQNIESSKKSTKQSVLEFLAKKYVLSREKYDPKTFKSDYYFILRSTGKDNFNAYYEKISKKDDQNLAFLYKKGWRSNIKVISTNYDGKNNFIAVKFLKENYNIITGKGFSKTFEAQLKFYVSNYNFAKSKDAKLNFIVTDYELKEV